MRRIPIGLIGSTVIETGDVLEEPRVQVLERDVARACAPLSA